MLLFVISVVVACTPWTVLADGTAPVASCTAEPIHELRMLTARPGELNELHAWFRNHDGNLLAVHGIKSTGFFVPAGENPDGRLLCLFEISRKAGITEAWQAVGHDPRVAAIDPTSEGSEALVAGVTSIPLEPTDYSPALVAAKSAEPRVFELRTYTCPSPEHLAALDERFRDHTMTLFEKHGMTNLVYWHPAGTENSDRKLIYLLAHRSVDAAKESFAAFRMDPDWLAAKEASEKKAGGSLTEKERGVVSEFFTPTDYSPLR